MAEKLIISISGMRGIIGENLNPQIAAEYGAAFGSALKKKGGGETLKVCIGRDSRPSGQMLTCAVASGLTSVGAEVIDVGIVSTPGVGIMLRHLGCAGGVVITASHNPIPYNGIKLLLDNGMAPGPMEAGSIRQIYFEKDFDFVASKDCGHLIFNHDANSTHIEKVLALVDRELISKKKFKVVLDSVNGAGGPVTKMLLERFGCQVVAFNDEPTGLFAHTPEPTAANLTGLCDLVLEHRAQVGFAQDPDADRLAIVDENGRYIGEEYTLALAAKYVLGKTHGPVAANLSTSRMIDDVAAEHGVKVFRTPVGEANVAAAMAEHNCAIGGEGNGGVIDLRVGPIRDSLVGISLVLQLMAETGKTVSELVGEIGGYHMTKEKFAADEDQAKKVLEAAAREFKDACLDKRDGYRFDFADGWIHLRTSNTEPVMRMIIEAKDEAAAQEYIERVRALCQKVMG